MSIVIKPEAMKYRDPATGDYKGVDVVAERETSEQVADIQSEGATLIQAVQAAADAAMSVIPSQQTLTNLSNDFAPQYSSSSAYSVGDYCMHDYKLYRCKTAIASGGESWTVAHWTLASTASEITGVKNTLASNFDPSTNYSANEYVIYNEYLYQFTVNHSGAWTESDVVKVDLGGETTRIQSLLGFRTIIFDNAWKMYKLQQLGPNGSEYKDDGTSLWGVNYYHTQAIPVSTGDVVIVKGYGTSNYRNLYFYSAFSSELNFTLDFSNYCRNQQEMQYIVPYDGYVRLQNAKNYIPGSYAYILKGFAKYFNKFNLLDELGETFEETSSGWADGNYPARTIGSNGSIYKPDTTYWGTNYYSTRIYSVLAGDIVIIKAYCSQSDSNLFFYSSFVDETNFTLVDTRACRNLNEIIYVVPSNGYVRLQVETDSSHVSSSYAYIYTGYLARIFRNSLDIQDNATKVNSALSTPVPITVSAWNVRHFSDVSNINGCAAENVDTVLPQFKDLISKSFNTDFLCVNEWYHWFDRAKTIDAYKAIFKQFYPYHLELPEQTEEQNAKACIMSKYPCTLVGYGILPTVVVNIHGKSVKVVCWIQSGESTPEQRQANYATAISAFSGFDVVVFAGDFNTNQGTAELSTFTNAGYILGNGGYWGEIGTHATSNPDFPNGLPLDNIVSKGLIYKYFYKITEKITSDHNGVSAQLVLF